MNQHGSKYHWYLLRPLLTVQRVLECVLSVWVCLCLCLWVYGAKCMYDRQSLLDICNKQFCYEDHWQTMLNNLRLLCSIGPETTTNVPGTMPEKKRCKRCGRMRKRGKRRGVQARLTANPYRLAVPTVILANVSYLDSKMDYIRLWRASTRDCCVTVSTETWLNHNIADATFQLDGLTRHRADRAASQCGKLLDDGLAVYIKKSWCQDAKVVHIFWSPHVDTMTVKCRPFYLPWEFTVIIHLCTTGLTWRRLWVKIIISEQQRVHLINYAVFIAHPNYAVFIAAGDFNQASLKSVLPKFYQYGSLQQEVTTH